MPTTTKLSDTQLVILSQAAQRPDYCVLPMPPNLQAKAGPVTRALKALLKRGLILEQAGSNSDHEWRRDENGALLTLVIATAGLAAIGVEAGDHVPEALGPEAALGAAGKDEARVPKQGAVSGESTETAGTPASKCETITALLYRESGATLAELTTATGWQAHSVRGFLSGTLKKKLGYTVSSERSDDGVRRYRIAA